MTHCVIQWARLGDLFQTRPLLARIRCREPSANILLCVDEIYRALAAKFPEPHRVVSVPLRRYWAISKSGHRLDTLFTEFHTILDTLNIEAVDTAYVLNRSTAAVRFAEMLRPKEIRGFRDDDAAPDFSMAYIETMYSNPNAPPAHLADLWASLADAPLSSPEYPPPISEHFRSALPHSEKRIGIFVGAGDKSRTCPPEYWSEFMLGIAETTQEIVLLGTERDSELAKQIEESCRLKNLRVHNAVAGTDILSLGSLLSSCSLVVGSDTGGIHYAAALGIPVLGIYFGGARAAFTGPYAACARVLETETPVPGKQILPPKDAARIAIALLNGDSETPLGLTPGFALRSPIFDRWGLLYQSATERSSVSANARAPLWQGLACSHHGEQKIHRESAQKPVTVIIPASGQAHLTRECVAAISEECRELSAEILVVTADDPATQEIFSTELCNVKTFYISEGKSFACLCNQGAREAAGELLLFLNNDTLAERGGLKSLLASYSQNAPCILSPLLLYWDGLVQNAGIHISGNSIEEIKHGTWPEKLREVVGCDAVSGTAMLVSREVFTRLGGFDEDFINGYEDLDFCLRARQQGIRCLVDCQSRIRHFRGATPGRYQAEDKNRELFEMRWLRGRGSVNKRLSESAPTHEFTQDRSQENAPLVSVICAEEWWTAGSRVRWAGPLTRLQTNRMLRAEWYWIRDDEASWNRLSENFSRSALVILRRPLTTVSSHERLHELVLRARVPLLIDMDDVFLGRFSADSARGKARFALEKSFVRLLKEAQMVTASTSTLTESLQRYCLDARVLPNTVDPLWWPQAKDTKTLPGEMTIGFFGSPLHGLDLANIAPALAKFLDEEQGRVKLFVWGAFPEVLRTHPMVRQGGPFVPDYEMHLQRLARKPVDFAVVPLLDSPANRSRSLIRFLELGWHGIPAIYSRVGEYATYIKHGQDGLLAGETTDEWLAALRTLSHDAELRKTIITHARNTIEKAWTIEKHIQDYIEILHSLGIEKGISPEKFHKSEETVTAEIAAI